MLRKVMVLILTLGVVKSLFAATTIQHGVILDHREWTSGSAAIQAHDSLYNVKQHKPISFFKKKKEINQLHDNEDILLHIHVDPEIEGSVDQSTEMGGDVLVSIENYTSETQTYLIKSSFCISYSEDSTTDPCHSSSYRIELDPEGTFQLMVKRVFSYEFSEAGSFGAGFSIMAEKEGGVSSFTTYQFSTINIDEVEQQ